MGPFGDVLNALAFASFIKETREVSGAEAPRRPRPRVSNALAIARRLATAVAALRA